MANTATKQNTYQSAVNPTLTVLFRLQNPAQKFLKPRKNCVYLKILIKFVIIYIEKDKKCHFFQYKNFMKGASTMPVSVPNQKMITVHRERPSRDFLGIQNENWMLASQLLGPYGLQIYLYLAANADGWEMAFSPLALEQSIGLKSSTCRDHLKDLIKFGYLIQKKDGSNCYDFYEYPQTLIHSQPPHLTTNDCKPRLDSHVGHEQRQTFTIDSENKEINNNKISVNKQLINNEKLPIEVAKSSNEFVF